MAVSQHDYDGFLGSRSCQWLFSCDQTGVVWTSDNEKQDHVWLEIHQNQENNHKTYSWTPDRNANRLFKIKLDKVDCYEPPISRKYDRVVGVLTKVVLHVGINYRVLLEDLHSTCHEGHFDIQLIPVGQSFTMSKPPGESWGSIFGFPRSESSYERHGLQHRHPVLRERKCDTCWKKWSVAVFIVGHVTCSPTLPVIFSVKYV